LAWFDLRRHDAMFDVVTGARIEGKYKNNVLVASVSGGKSTTLFALRSGKLRDRVDAAVKAAARAADVARQKAEIANARYGPSKACGVTRLNVDVRINYN
jgi:hypothetical protein